MIDVRQIAKKLGIKPGQNAKPKSARTLKPYQEKQQQDRDRMVKVFSSPGQLTPGRSPRPTANKEGTELNMVNFASGGMILFSDGSYRRPGRRKVRVVLQNGQETVLQGRQLRMARKKARRWAVARVKRTQGQPVAEA